MASVTDVLCFSHLRWGFVFQRPNHLLSRAARTRRVFFFEEPRIDAATTEPSLELREVEPSLTVCTPRVPEGLSEDRLTEAQFTMLDRLLQERKVRPELLWYYSPMALSYARELQAPLVVYDCMDELSAFADAPRRLREMETELFRRADIVFAGGMSLYRAKRKRHANVHVFPSSVDARHFGTARDGVREPEDQARIPGPRIGFFGVIDERLDLELLARVADERPQWQLVMLGPVTKIDPASLPQRANLHWLGKKDYQALPSYLSGWDVAMMPFALNKATAFISPTKTLEYMAAGKPIVSTAVADVVEPYGQAGIVDIADAGTFVRAIESALGRDRAELLRTCDAWVARTSWDQTWRQMEALLERTLADKRVALEETEG